MIAPRTFSDVTDGGAPLLPSITEGARAQAGADVEQLEVLAPANAVHRELSSRRIE
jgi:hypothetical protein